MGTKSIQMPATPAPAPAAPAAPTTPAVLEALTPFKRADGYDMPAMMRAAHMALGPKEYETLIRSYERATAPQGLIETFGSTFGDGWEHEAHRACALIGAGVVVVGVLEALGRALDVPSLQIASRIAKAVLGE